MKSFLAAVALLGLFAILGRADNPKPARDTKDSAQTDKPVPSLNVGDAAPALKVTKWLQGDPVTKFEPGKIYVVDFWATWCGGCIRGMPHLAELQTRYKDKGVTIIGFTSRDMRGEPGSNTDEMVAAFVKKRGPMLGYRFAYADDDTTYDTWMKAADHHSLPSIFVIDKAERIAYIGGPLFLDLVLEKVVAGNTSPKEIGDEVAKAEAEYKALCAPFNDQKTFFERDPETYFRALKVFEAKYPPLADCLPSACIKLMLLLKQTNLDDAKKYAEKLVARAIREKNVFVLEWLALVLSEKKERKELLALAVQTADALVQIVGDDDAYYLTKLAKTYCAAGDIAKAKASAHKAGQAGDKDAGDLVNLASVYCIMGDMAEAKAYAHKASSLVDDKRVRPLIELAKLYSTLGEQAEAQKYARKAINASAGWAPAGKQEIEEEARKLGVEK